MAEVPVVVNLLPLAVTMDTALPPSSQPSRTTIYLLSCDNNTFDGERERKNHMSLETMVQVYVFFNMRSTNEDKKCNLTFALK